MAEQIHGSNVVTAAEQGRRERVGGGCAGVAGFVMPACSTARLKAR